jgi:hypothetical protein
VSGGSSLFLPELRVLGWGYFGSETMMRQVVIDTGASACLLPFRFWSVFDNRGDITWLSSAPPTVPAGGLPRMSASGGSYSFWLGRVRLALADLGSGRLAPRDVLAMCTDDPQTPPAHLRLPLIVGLADVMHGRTLLVEASADGQQWTASLSEP